MGELLAEIEEPSECEWCHQSHKGVCDEMSAEASRRVIADPDIDILHRTMQMALTTSPSNVYSGIMLMWMQLDPRKWSGYSPEECVHVGMVTGMKGV